MPKSILLLLLLLATLPIQAQSPYLVKDINTTISFDTSSSAPAGFTSYHNRTFFAATTEASGTELWSSGGNGTSLVADIIPGSSGSNPAGLKVVNDVLLFNARDVDHGVELWVTDGTAAGTRLLLDINPGPSSSNPAGKTAYGNRMLFSADDGTNGRELWISDGTSAGTRMVRDINPGTAGSFPGYFVAFGNSVYFSAAGGLWKTDGTEAGTVKVAAVAIRHLAAVGGKLFFEGNTGASNWEPWASDGTEAGTRMVTDILPGPAGSLNAFFPSLGFTALGNRVLFAANDDVHGRELWITDGTAAGTRMLRDIFPGATGTFDERFLYMGAFGDRVWFSATEPEHGEELWVTDGSESGTALFADLVPGPDSSGPSGFVVANGKLFFAAYADATYRTRLWVTDESTVGVRVVGEAALHSSNLTAIDGAVYFPGSTALYGTEPWMSDGTDAGTRMVSNLAADEAPSSSPFMLTATKDLLFFYATEGPPSPISNISEYSLWRSDGTAGGTFKLREAGQHAPELTAGGPFVFFPDSVNGQTLWMSDGTIAGTKPADDFLFRFGNHNLQSLFPFGDTLFARVSFFESGDGTLWKTVAAPNAAAQDLGARNPYGLIEVAGHYVFYAQTQGGIHDRSLWTTDGTRAGTYAIVPDLGADYQGVSPLVNAAGTIFFLKARRDESAKLWKSDGTIDGTTVVREMPEIGIYRADIAAAGRRVFIAAAGALWTSDGTESGTIKIATPEIPSAYDRSVFQSVGQRILFPTRNDGGAGDLWSSDGTQSGTFKLAASVSGVVEIEGLVYFAGTDVQHGVELWTTDGTVEGTKLLVDLNPGPASSNPGGFTKIGNTIYFSAYTETAGRELWALPLTEPRLSIADARASEGDGTSAVVRFTVSLVSAPNQTVTVDYATTNATATGGADYEAAAGTLTFLPGETVKFIDVHVAGDSAPENNETFFVRLSNAHGARLVKDEATGIIDDEDQAADLSVASTFLQDGFSAYDAVTVTNLGPRSATEVAVRITATPPNSDPRCSTCFIPQLAVDETVTAGYGSTPYEQIYLSAIATARQDDPQTSNNAVSWTVNGFRTMIMSPAFLTTGAIARVTAISTLPDPSLTLSDPSVVAISSNIVKLGGDLVGFIVTALKPGTSVLYLDRQQRSIVITVVAPGTTPRWPGAVAVSTDFSATRFDKPVTITVTPTGVAPLSAATATGTIIVTAAGQELARRTITSRDTFRFPVYLPVLGANNLQITYSGDASFLPQTFAPTVFVRQGDVSITGTLLRTAGTEDTYALALQVAGSPAAAPTGIISVLNGATELARISLQPSGAGTSRAEVTLTNLPENTTLTLNYLGDPFYSSGSQQIRAAEARRRAIRH